MAAHITEAAKAIGVSPATLKRWFRTARVRDVARDRNGYRIFDDADIERLRRYANQRIEPADYARGSRRPVALAGWHDASHR
jgi:predicted site-specific integrase-resolvase